MYFTKLLLNLDFAIAHFTRNIVIEFRRVKGAVVVVGVASVIIHHPTST